MPDSSSIQILYDEDVDITNNVMYRDATFDLVGGALPGTMSITLKDVSRTLSFVSGRRLKVLIDGQPLWHGYVTWVGRKFAFPVVRTDDLSKVTQRLWVLRGVSLDILFDKRVLRNTADYLHQLPNFSKTDMDGALIRDELCPNYLDLPAWLDYETEVDDVVPPFDPLVEGGTGIGAWMQQGSTWRAQMEDFAQFSGAIFYIRPDEKLSYKALEDSVAPWSFSDQPNGSSSFGFRDLDLDQDGAGMVNDAMIWGGSEWAGSGQTVFARETDSTSITDHERWQLAEAHFGEDGFKLQSGVDARAKVIVLGDPGSVGGDANRGLRFPQWNLTLTWFSHNVPEVMGTKAHLVPGHVTTFTFHSLGEDDETPLVLVLPLRSLSISFPAIKPPQGGEAQTYVQFTGTFSLQAADPKKLWTFIRSMQTRQQRAAAAIATATTTDTSAAYGTLYNGDFSASPDGTETVFSLPSSFSYIGGTTAVYNNGILQIPGTDYTESDPAGGEITFTTPPGGSDELWVRCWLG